MPKKGLLACVLILWILQNSSPNFHFSVPEPLPSELNVGISFPEIEKICRF